MKDPNRLLQASFVCFFIAARDFLPFYVLGGIVGMFIPLMFYGAFTSTGFRAVHRYFCGFGALCNFTAIAANGFHMPVALKSFHAHGIWRSLQDTDRLYFLCDIWHGFSLGDLLLATGTLILLLGFTVQHLRRRITAQP